MSTLIFSGMTLVVVFLAAFMKNLRQAILSLWVAGLGIGAIYMTLGAEFLAILQWIVSTLTTLSFVFFSVMFGEYQDLPNVQRTSNEKSQPYLLLLMAIVLGLGFTAVIAQVSKSLFDWRLQDIASSDLQYDRLEEIGTLLTQDHLLSLEVLGLLLFLVLVGSGVVARLESEES